jgi:hypothetical protein
MSAFGERWLKFQLQCLARFTLCVIMGLISGRIARISASRVTW